MQELNYDAVFCFPENFKNIFSFYLNINL